jgi:hypothetical protein
VYGLALHERAQTLLKHLVGAYVVDL